MAHLVSTAIKKHFYIYVSQIVMRFFFLLLAFFPAILKAQVSIHGNVKDRDNEPVPYAQIILKSAEDSVILKTDIADSAGVFKISTKSEMPLLLQATAVGYERTFITITDSTAKADVSIVLKSNANNLKTVEVLASKPLLERKADRIIFNVGSSVSSIGSDVYELLKKAPGVRVNDNNGISIAGKSTVSVMIDDKLQQLGVTELAAMLRSMSADNVDKIEVITTPPARYDAQGNSGIINIVTKKNKNEGFNGSINIGYQQRTRGTEKFGDNLNYHRGKLNIYSTGNTNLFDFQSQQKTTVSYGSQVQAQSLDQGNHPVYNRYHLGANYSLTADAVLGASVTIGTTNRYTDQFYNAPVTSSSTGTLDSTLRTTALDKETALRQVANLNYEWRIDTSGKKLNIDADYFTRTENDNRDFNSQSFLQDGMPAYLPFYKRSTGKQRIDISSIKADMVLPYDAVELSFGAKASFIHTNSDNRFYNLVGSDYTVDISKTNQFDYTENTQAAYFSASKSGEKWEGQLGLRAENTQTVGISSSPSQTVKGQYLQLFPTVYLQYQANENNTFNINYSRRVGRPSYEELNPFREYGSGGSYETGNPFLRPSFYHSIELSYTFKSKLILTAYTGIVNNMHARISNVDTVGGTFFFTNANAGSSYSTGMTATLVLNPFSWWECNAEIDGYYDRIRSDYYKGNASVNGLKGFEVEVNNTFSLNNAKTLVAELSFDYVSRFQYDFVEHGAYYALGGGLKALFFDKKFVLALNVQDALRTEKYNFRNIYNDVFEQNYDDARCITFSLTWKFGSNKFKGRREHEAGTEEINRAK